jgi:hypothetical protein
MAKKVVKKLAKKNYGGPDSIPPNTIKAKDMAMSVETNPNYRKTSITDPKTGDNVYTRKLGSTGPSKAVKGTYAPSGTYAPDAVSKKGIIPTVTRPIVAKKGGAISKFAKLAPPYNKATFADKIVGAKKKK